MEKEEVADLGPKADHAGKSELTAYFCVSRTRMVLRQLFKQPDTEAKKSDEGSGSLFLWAES